MLNGLFQFISQMGRSTILWRVDSWLGDWSCAQFVSKGGQDRVVVKMSAS